VTAFDLHDEATMTDKRTPKNAETARPGESDQELPFRRSCSAAEYDPAGNWAAERRDEVQPGHGEPGMEGEASGAAVGGFGPEGGFSKDAHADDASSDGRDRREK
jgi:hypothetical protein